MIHKIYSKIKPDKLMHMVCKPELFSNSRTDIVPSSEYIQLSILNLQGGKTFVPHKHIYKEVPNQAIAQESWVVIKGQVQAIFYDLDDSIIEKKVLESGDLSITLFGGHNYVILKDDTLVLEYKTGPYYGQSLDKQFIGE